MNNILAVTTEVI